MSTLTIRFIGICCLIETRRNGSGYGKRVVLPADRRANDRSDGLHIPYIEVEVVDEPQITGRFADDRMYGRDLVSYRRFQLSGDRISIANAVQPDRPQLNVLSTYTERVPSLTKVTPGFPRRADADVLRERPDPARVAAYFDITNGDLHAGPPNIFATRFSMPTEWPTRRLAQWVELQLPIRAGQGPVIEVESFGRPLGTRSIRLSERTVRITIGNQLKGDIERNMGDVELRQEDFREHWRLYHDLFSGVPETASLPERTAAVPNGCVASGYP